MAMITRTTTYPILNQQAWDYYTRAKALYWTPNEVTLSKDKSDFMNKLSDPERHFVKFVLAFFSSFDGLVNISIIKRFKKEFTDLEIRYFYEYQVMMENIHAEMYSILLMELISDPTEQLKLLSALTEIPIIEKMGKYIAKCINYDEPLTTQLLRQACVEGIFFTGCFCVIYWLQQRGLMPGLAQSNELIARDEALHTEFAIYLIKYSGGISKDVAIGVILDAIKLAKEFMRDAIIDDMRDMNYIKICQYLEQVGDNILVMLDLDPIFNGPRPFVFMNQINLKNKSDFFDKRVTEYAKPGKQQDSYVEYDF